MGSAQSLAQSPVYTAEDGLLNIKTVNYTARDVVHSTQRWYNDLLISPYLLTLVFIITASLFLVMTSIKICGDYRLPKRIRRSCRSSSTWQWIAWIPVLQFGGIIIGSFILSLFFGGHLHEFKMAVRALADAPTAGSLQTIVLKRMVAPREFIAPLHAEVAISSLSPSEKSSILSPLADMTAEFMEQAERVAEMDALLVRAHNDAVQPASQMLSLLEDWTMSPWTWAFAQAVVGIGGALLLYSIDDRNAQWQKILCMSAMYVAASFMLSPAGTGFGRQALAVAHACEMGPLALLAETELPCSLRAYFACKEDPGSPLFWTERGALWVQPPWRSIDTLESIQVFADLRLTPGSGIATAAAKAIEHVNEIHRVFETVRNHTSCSTFHTNVLEPMNRAVCRYLPLELYSIFAFRLAFVGVLPLLFTIAAFRSDCKSRRVDVDRKARLGNGTWTLSQPLVFHIGDRMITDGEPGGGGGGGEQVEGQVEGLRHRHIDTGSFFLAPLPPGSA